jgi:hypothetical protein
MNKIISLLSALALCLVVGCGVAMSSKLGEVGGEFLTKEKDEVLAKVQKVMPDCDKLVESLKAKIAEATGDQKLSLEKILSKLTDLRKTVMEKLEDLKKSGMEGLKDKLAAFTKESDELHKVMGEATEALKK